MRVTVMTPSRTKMLLDEVETLRDVKRQIMARTGIPARQQLIYFKGRQLKSFRRPLSTYSVRDGSTLYLVKRLGVCRCLACRNSRYIEREEVEEERLQLLRLLGESPESDGLSPTEVSPRIFDGSEVEISAGRTDTDSWPAYQYGYRRQPTSELDMVQEETAITPETVEANARRSGDEDTADVIETDDAEGEPMDEPDDEAVEADDGAEEDGEEMGEEEDADDIGGGMEDAGEAEESPQELDDVDVEEEGEEEEAMDGVAGQTEDLSEENEETDAGEEDLELSGEEADDEEDRDEGHEEAIEVEEEEADTLEPEDIEDETTHDNADGETEEQHTEDAHDEEDEDATILYSLVTGREDVSQPREESHLTSGGADGDDEEEEDGEERRTEPVFVRQQAFEEDGANSVGEEDPDITELEEEEEEPTLAAGALSPTVDSVPERVEDLLLAMTRPTPDPEEEDSQEEQYPEDDPLFDPPDEEDPLLRPQDAEDAGYSSGDEMDRV